MGQTRKSFMMSCVTLLRGRRLSTTTYAPSPARLQRHCRFPSAERTNDAIKHSLVFQLAIRAPHQEAWARNRILIMSNLKPNIIQYPGKKTTNTAYLIVPFFFESRRQGARFLPPEPESSCQSCCLRGRELSPEEGRSGATLTGG